MSAEFDFDSSTTTFVSFPDTLVAETDPTEIPGIPATLGTLYRRTLPGEIQLWVKIDTDDTAWERITRRSEVVSMISAPSNLRDRVSNLENEVAVLPETDPLQALDILIELRRISFLLQILTKQEVSDADVFGLLGNTVDSLT